MGSGAVLVVEDDADIASMLQLHVERAGYRYLHAPDGDAGITAVREQSPQVVLLDIGLPDVDGYTVARAIRETSDVPILMVTARDSETDAIVGFDVGADDYITKPFSPREVVARIGAVLRRSTVSVETSSLTVAGHTIDLGRRLVSSPSGDQIRPTAREFDLLVYLVENKGLVLTRGQILDAVWGFGYETESRTVDVHVRQLRKHLPDLPLSTVWGVGYEMEDV